MSACVRSSAMSSVNRAQIVGIGPGDDDRRNAGPVHRRNLRPRLVHRHLVRRVRADHRDAGGVRAGLMVGRPVHRTALEEAVAHAVARHDGGRACRGDIRSGAGMRNAELIEPRDRCSDCRLAVVHVVGDADGGNAGGTQRLAADVG